MKTSKIKRMRMCSLVGNTLRVERCVRVLGWELRRVKSKLVFTRICTNQLTNWLMHSWNIFGAQMNHMHTQTHKIHHGLDMGEATTFPLIVFYVIRYGGYIQMSFCPRGVPKFLKLSLLAFCRSITSYANLRLK